MDVDTLKDRLFQPVIFVAKGTMTPVLRLTQTFLGRETLVYKTGKSTDTWSLRGPIFSFFYPLHCTLPLRSLKALMHPETLELAKFWLTSHNQFSVIHLFSMFPEHFLELGQCAGSWTCNGPYSSGEKGTPRNLTMSSTNLNENHWSMGIGVREDPWS